MRGKRRAWRSPHRAPCWCGLASTTADLESTSSGHPQSSERDEGEGTEIYLRSHILPQLFIFLDKLRDPLVLVVGFRLKNGQPLPKLLDLLLLRVHLGLAAVYLLPQIS